MTQQLDPATKLLFALTVFSALMMTLMLYVLFKTGDPLSVDGPECVPEKLDTQCRLDELCIGGVCIPDEETMFCEPGDPCGSGLCECEVGYFCAERERVCIAQEQVLMATDCRRPEVKRMLRDLSTVCKSRESHGFGRKIESCGAQVYSQYHISNGELDKTLAMFPNRFTVHFLSGQYDLSRDLKSQIRQHSESLATAKEIFVIGRASPSKNSRNADKNYEISLRRMTAVATVIREMLGESGETIVTPWTVGEKAPLPIKLFREKYARDPILASADKPRLHRLLAAKRLSRSEKSWLTSIINQGVLVVAIPCGSGEYDPDSDRAFGGEESNERSQG